MVDCKIVFVLAVHSPDDERIWFQQAATLLRAGYKVSIITLSKGEKFSEIPDVVICDNPKAVVAATVALWRLRRLQRLQRSQRTGILYDITEWYPSKKNLRGLPFYHQALKFLLLTGVSLLAAFLASGFIFGEYYKALPFRRLFFWKKYIFLPYYAHTKNVKCYLTRDISRECILLYAGRLTREKGFYTVFSAVAECARLMPATNFILRIISDDKLPPLTPSGFTIEHIPLLPFPDFCAETGKADICVDLRTVNWENNRCLPIKLFYYLASGRPIIYSNLKAIRKEIPEIASIGALVNTQSEAVNAIIDYITNQEKYKKHCLYARKLAENKYDWSKYEKSFVDFIGNFVRFSQTTIPFNI
jgi:glycosyltransferase involved in cell wall biosynthesis